tara:strand:- start:910 stop:1236 length:327 start_codon:yes stop_codon:yes gene_type:complete
MITKRELNKVEAIRRLVGGGVSGNTKDGLDIVYYDGQTPPSESEIDAELARMQAEYDSQAYARNRKVEYDALNQLELMSDDSINGTTTHKDAIVAIKAKWPKDNSGPV